MKRKLALILLLTGLSCFVQAAPFQVSDIRVDGLQRIDLGAVLRAFAVDIGEEVDEFRLARASKSLFATGYFNDIQLYRDGSVLVVKVLERPALSKIEIDGNKALETDALMDGLKNMGLAEGEVFQRAALERIRLELLRLYAAQGRYGAQIESELNELPENRLGLKINIREGKPATIQHINVVGNQVFSDEILESLFELEVSGFWSFFGNEDRYSREKLSGDLERLRSYYLDRGYINFKVESTEVSLTPDRNQVYITVSISEGEQFQFGSFDLVGDLVIPREELAAAVVVKQGDTFSRRLMVRSSDQIIRMLGDAGFLQANVNPVPAIDEANKRVDIKFFVDPGRRIYVRRIDFRGNTTTADDVLRREMRQMEGGWASTDKMEKSKQRLERLGYFSAVNLETSPVPGSDDQIDLEYSVTEQLSGNLAASIGFSQSSGLILAASIAQENFLGTGKSVSFSISNSDTDTEYSFRYTDPYYTVDGVSRGFNVYYRKQDFDEDDLSDYNLDSYGGSVSFGYPIDEYQRLNFSAGFENLQIKIGDPASVPQEILDFVAIEGSEYDQVLLTGSWSDNHLNRGMLATDGYSQSLSLEMGAPGSDLNYYKLRYRGQRYLPLTDSHRWALSFKTQLGFGDSFGDTSEMPFFKNFYAGGFSTVRGFKNNSLGPRSTPDSFGERDPLGGNVLITGSAELIFPLPWVEDTTSLRTLLFVDMGSVFDTKCSVSNPGCTDQVRVKDMSAAAGVGLSWLTFIGPMSFTLARPLKEQEFDETETFQFSLGRTF
ncbi:outer membrane protein assembly factor BamA [Motiliproteus sediminis]|uniref:outer membrane protein assembly factor BamA n=1 Tax=Motiliproteus sediminis TaxID=1468178 RepID=UPI001AEF74C4|nr:outer membrane protein assembly factor BamA [Motiliproteus sediminis]